MPRVPTESVPQEELKPTPINPKTAATLGGEVVDLAEGIGAIGDQIKKVQAITSENNAIKYLSDSNNLIHNKYQTYPNLDDALDKANEDLDKNYQNALSMITDPEARARSSETLLRMRDSKDTAINNMIQGRILAAGRASVRPTNDAFQTEYNGANTPAQEEDIKNRYNAWMDKQISGQHISPEAAENLREKQLYEFGNQKAKNDIAITQDVKTIQTIKDKINNGDYGDLRTVDYDHLMNKADRKAGFIEAQLKRSMNNIQERNARNLQQMSMTNNPNMEQHAEELYYTKQISQQDFKLYTSKKPIVSPQTDGASYNESLAYIADPKTSIDDVRRFIQGKYNQNLLAPDDRDKLYNLAIKPYGDSYKSVKDLIGLKEAKADESHFFKRMLNSAREALRSYTKIPYIGDKIPDIMGQPASKLKMDSDKVTKDVSVEGYSGNISLGGRPVIHNAGGSWSSEKSFSFQDKDGKEVLIPSIVNGKELSKKDAIAHYHKTGENLGKFDSADEADAMADKIHSRYSSESEGTENKDVQMAKRFLQKISDKSPEDYISSAHEVVNEQRLIDRPEIGGYPEKGTTEQDENGIRSTTRPDGSTQQEEDNPTESLDANY